MKTNPTEKLSIIVSVRNERKHIEHFIRSILNCYSDLEVLLGDDASSDGTKEIIKKYESDARIKALYFDKNMGAGAVRNRLLEIAKGDFIAIQDADDPPQPHRFLKQIEYLKKNPNVDVVGSWADLITSNGRHWGTIQVRSNPSLCDWIFQRALVHASVMFRQRIKSYAKYNEFLPLGEDYYFLTSLYRNGCRFENIQLPLYRYVVNPQDLLTRGRRHFFQLVHAKFVISRLFSWPTQWIFIIANFFILVVAFFRGSVHKMRYGNTYLESGSKDGGFHV